MKYGDTKGQKRLSSLQGCANCPPYLDAPSAPSLLPLRVWYKHRDNLFIPAYAQGLAIALVQVPVSLIEAAIFSLVMYFMVRGVQASHNIVAYPKHQTALFSLTVLHCAVPTLMPRALPHLIARTPAL